MNEKFKRSVIIGLASIIILGLFAYNRFFQSKNLDIGGNNETLFFADGGSPLSALLYVAYEKTYFFTQKVNFHMSFYQSGRDSLNALLEGRADLATVSDVPIVHAMLEEKDFFIIATIATTRTGVGIIAMDDIKVPTELKGAKIGYSPGTNSEYFLRQFLIKYGISNSDVVLVPIAPDHIENELGARRIQAASVFDPALSNIKDILGNRVQVFYAPDVYTFSWNVVASKRMLNYPSALESIIRAFHVAEEYVQENPNNAIQITSRYLRINENQSKRMWGSMDLEVNLLQSLLVKIEEQAKWMSEFHKKGKIPDIGKYFYSDPMKVIIPNKVTVIE